MIVIQYAPRYPQDEIHPQIESHRFKVIVAHRRLGKTVLAVNHLIKKAMECKTGDGRYAYIAPFLKQAKLIAWDYLKRFTRNIPGVKHNEGELICEVPTGGRIYLFGADNADALRGTFLDEVVADEYSQFKPDVFSEIIRPALLDRNGGCLFMGTPKGQNNFFEQYNYAVKAMADGDPAWWAGMYRGDETGVISEAELAELRKVMTDSTYRQEILCDFTAASDNVLITIDMVSQSCQRRYEITDLIYEPTILGVDVARFGDDSSVCQVRHGKKADEPIIFKGIDNMALVGQVSTLINRINPDATFIDAGRGEGVIDRLRQLGYRGIQEINFGGKAFNPHYANRRAEMWDMMRQWIQDVGQLPNIPALKADLVTPTYKFDANNAMLLESKQDIKKRLGHSPDTADALALTFAMPVRSRKDDVSRANTQPRMAIR
jgi:hypothetical protein